MEEFYDAIIKELIKTPRSKLDLGKLKIKLCKKYKLKKIPTDIEILLNVKEKDIPILKKSLLTKPGRTASGVTVIAIMTKPRKCPHGKCAMCPGGPSSSFGNVPQSYTGREPATMRGIRNNYDPYVQVFNRLEQYVVLGHNHDKIELIIMGGTFIAAPKKYRDEFVKLGIKALNDFSELFYIKGVFDIQKFKLFFKLPGGIHDDLRIIDVKKKILKLKIKRRGSLEKEQLRNESSFIRCIGLTVETRPDYAQLSHAKEFLRLGCTRVELGVQSVYETALKNIERGHTVKDNIIATKVLKDLGFKINYHYMLGLPGINDKKEIDGLNMLFSNEAFRPDMLKIYPCMVLKGTKLFESYKKGKFDPMSTEKAVSLLTRFKPLIPEYCRVMRVQRDIPTEVTIAGVNRTNLRQYVHDEMKKKGVVCRCIMCREVGRTKAPSGKVKMKILKYDASDGLEFFISMEDNANLYGYCRLRFPSRSLIKEIPKNSALIRELHVVGPAVIIGESGSVQHKGFGKKLLKKAEEIAQKFKKAKMVVISGIGVREYYRKLGYIKEGPYMVKKL